MESKQVQLYLDREKTIEASPVTSAECVILSDSNDLQKVLDNDLTTPTVVHEETSFKVGQGDIDVSGSIVDGEVGQMVIKGQTYQNILPEPSLRNSMTNGKTMQKLNESYDSVNTVDGVCKSAILSGQTLVNLAQPSLRAWTTNLNSDTASLKATTEEFIIDWSKGVPFNAWIQARNDNSPVFGGMLKADTDYTFIIRILENNPTFEGVTVTGNVANLQMWGLRGYHAKSFSLQAGVTGTIALKYNFNTLATATQDNENIFGIAVHGTASNGTKTIDGGKLRISKDVIVLEGDYTNNYQYIPYFEGMQSVKLPVLTTSNVIQRVEFETIKANLSDGSLTSIDSESSAGGCIEYFDISKLSNAKFVFKTTQPFTLENYFTFFFYDKDKTYIKWLNGQITKIADGLYSSTIPTVENAKYLRIIKYDTETQMSNIVKNSISAFVDNSLSIKPTFTIKSNILSTPEDLELRRIGNIKDKLNLMTGELTQGIGEIVLNGQENWRMCTLSYQPTDTNYINYDLDVKDIRTSVPILCDTIKVRDWTISSTEINSRSIAVHSTNKFLRLCIEKSIAPDVESLKTYLSTNMAKVQYQLETPVVKTVDLSTSGNWEKIVLDGGEEWIRSTTNNNYFMETRASIIPNRVPDVENYFFHDTDLQTLKVYTSNTNIGICIPSNGGIRVRTQEVLNGQSLEEFKQWVSQNPITIWYQTSTHQDSTQVKQPIFFKDGHIQLSSGADHSLIPTLDYQAKTSNSYVMDLMKTNTKYTMKAKSASGTFTIDGTSYGAGTNGTFTTPSSMTNKLLVMSDTAHEEVMILEGDVTDKTIPYFKGIKSAFEDEDKIEVLSTGKNLFKQKLTDYDYLGNYAENETIIKDDCIEWNATTSYKGAVYYYINVKPNTKYTLSLQRNIQQTNCVTIYDGFVTSNVNNITSMGANKNSVTFNTKSDKITIRFSNGTILDTLFKIYDVQLEESSIPTQYELHKSNCTKIPLLSPLRSLPNGVCDELIIDRMKKKATLIQRVREVVLNGNENWVQSQVRDNHYVAMLSHCSEVGIPEKYPSTLLCSHFINQQPYAYDREGINVHVNYNFHIGFLKNRLSDASVNSCKKWLSQNPVIVHHELATPVVTEIDLENFPLVYKDGHIFLNSEIAPVVEIDYNINQSQLIIGNGETLLRHEQEILDLDKLIVSFVDCEYRLRLLKFDMELSMMALAE